MTHAEAEQGQWLTQAELASRSGRSIAAVRSWVRRRREQSLLRTQRSNRGETQVWTTPELLVELGQAGDMADDAPSAMLADEAGELRHMLGRAEGELAAELRRSADLTATLVAEREAHRMLLEHERVRGDRLEAALAEARRPWLARVLDGLRRKGS